MLVLSEMQTPPLVLDASRTLGKTLFPGAFHYELVSNERDELAVCGLVVLRVDVVAENAVNVLDFAARPCDLDCMAYGTLDL